MLVVRTRYGTASRTMPCYLDLRVVDDEMSVTDVFVFCACDVILQSSSACPLVLDQVAQVVELPLVFGYM
jgi:hypothetical protein